VVRTLSKVRHVPDMTCNLISLGTLEPNGCRYSAEHGVLKVTKGAMVLMQRLRQSLYFLHVTTVTGSTTVCTTLADVDTVKLCTCNWAILVRRPGMTILSKKGCLGSDKCFYLPYF